MASSFFPTHGGAELRFLRYLPLLQEYGVDVEVVTGTPKLKKFSQQDYSADWRKTKIGELIAVTEIESVQMRQYRLPETGSAKRSQILLDQVIARCENNQVKPDVIQLLLPLPNKAISQLKKIKATAIPVVFSYAIAHTFSNNAIAAKVQRWKIRRVYDHYDCIITASSVLKDLVVDISSNIRIEIIPNGVDTAKFSPIANQDEKESIRKKLGLPKSVTIIALVGAIHPRKGTDLLISAWSQQIKSNKNLHLLLIGPRFDQTRVELRGFKEKIEQLIASSEFSDNVHFVGQAQGVNDYLKASDVFVFPSEKEGMPNAVLEAMATGLPTVLTPFVGLSKDFGEAGREYVLVDRSVDAISSAIQSVLENESLLVALGNNARDWVVKTMNLKTSVRMYADLYHSLAQRTVTNK